MGPVEVIGTFRNRASGRTPTIGRVHMNQRSDPATVAIEGRLPSIVTVAGCSCWHRQRGFQQTTSARYDLAPNYSVQSYACTEAPCKVSAPSDNAYTLESFPPWRPKWTEDAIPILRRAEFFGTFSEPWPRRLDAKPRCSLDVASMQPRCLASMRPRCQIH